MEPVAACWHISWRSRHPLLANQGLVMSANSYWISTAGCGSQLGDVAKDLARRLPQGLCADWSARSPRPPGGALSNQSRPFAQPIRANRAIQSIQIPAD